MSVLKYFVAVLLPLLATACAGLNNGAPPVLTLRDGHILASSEALSNIRTTIASDCLDVTAPSGTPDDVKARRNRLVTAYMFAIDLSYDQYERNLLDSFRENDLGAAITSLALASIGGVVGNQDVARALSTTNAIVTGTHTAIGRDYLINQTLTTLQTQMRASRAAQRAIILERLSFSYDNWNSCLALSDVLAYEQAGTLNAAIAAVAASAADANRQNEARAQSVIPRIAYNTGSLAVALRAYLSPGDASVRPARIRIATTALEGLVSDGLVPSSGLPTNTRLGQIIIGAESDDVRRLLIQRIASAESNATAKAALEQAIR